MKKYVNNSFITKSPSEYKNGTAAVTNLPVTIYTDGQPVSSYTLKGNTSVSGTPSPSNPVTIEGVGEETANLFNVNAIGNIYPNPPTTTQRVGLVVNNLDTNNDYYLSINNPSQIQIFYARFDGETRLDTSALSTTGNVLIPMTGANAVRFWVSEGDSWSSITNIMLSKGSTAQSYEPYGYKISILKDLQPLTPIYLNEPMYILSGDSGTYYDSIVKGQSSFEIKRIGIAEFDGSEGWNYDSTYERFTLDLPDCYNIGLRIVPLKCTHFVDISDGRAIGDVPYNSVYLTSSATTTVLNVKTNDFLTVPDFTTWLGQQKTAGTPVKLYYVLKSTQNIPVDLPTIETTGGTATIDVDTTVKPSEIDLTYHGWHTHEPLKRENGAWT